jgi:hypothetical protein
MWWKLVLQVAVAAGLDKWAKAKAEQLVQKIIAKAQKKVEQITSAVPDVNPAE